MRLPWELFGVHLGWSIFWCAQLGCSNGPPTNFKNNLKQMVWDAFWGSFWEDQPRRHGQKMRSHAAWDSFFMFAKRSHAAWRSFSLTKLRSHAGGASFFLYVTFKVSLCHLRFSLFYNVFCYVTFKIQRKTNGFRYVTSGFCLFYIVFAMLPSNVQWKIKDFVMLPPDCACFILFLLCYLQLSNEQ